MATRTPLTATEIDRALAGLPGWRPALQGLHTTLVCPSPRVALDLVAAVGAAAEELDHHPDLDWRYRHVFLRLSTHSAGGAITGQDVALARRTAALAAQHGATLDPTLCRTVQIGLDTDEPERLIDFWQGVLGYRRDGDELHDPFARGPSLWFQQTPTPATSRLHLDVTVAPEQLDGLHAGATGAGGAALDDAFRPSWRVLADPDGNRVCLCTTLRPPAD